MENKTKRGARASETQKEFLIHFLEERPYLANDKFTTVDGAHSRENEWNNLSHTLNSLGGAIKDGIKWRKYWKDLTINVRDKDSAIKEQRVRSGINGYIPIKDLSDTDKRIVGIITPEAVEGVSASVGEIGFGEIITQDIIYCEDKEEVSNYVDDSLQADPQDIFPAPDRQSQHLAQQTIELPSTSRQKRPPKQKRTLSSSTDKYTKS